jgi:N-methylhydantoinase B
MIQKATNLYRLSFGELTLDAIDLEIIYQSTQQIARELTVNMLRTGYSNTIKESLDFTFCVFDPQARLVAQGIPQPLHIGPISEQVREVRRLFGDKLVAGDAIIVNHPYRAAQNHATDVTVISPIFYEGKLSGYIGNTAHKPDFGGMVPGTNSPAATELFQEGLLLPPVYLFRAGQLNQDVYEIICANTRTPEVTWGDVNAQAQTNVYGVQKFSELFSKHGVQNVIDCWAQWMDICETELRAQIARLPRGTYGPEFDCLDDDGINRDKPLNIGCMLEVREDNSLHFTLSSDEQAKGPLNLRPCVSRSIIECWVKMAFGQSVPVNDGLARVVAITYPEEGSLLNPKFPAPVNMYTRPSVVVSAVCCRVLGRVMPELMPAPASGSSGGFTGSARHPRNGKWMSFHEIYVGGGGARPNGDGVSAQDDLALNILNTPVEAMETEFPVRIDRYGLLSDSGGAGKFRGGLGAVRDWHNLADEMVCNLRTDRFKHSQHGVFGARPAQPGHALRNPGNENEESMFSKVAGMRLGKHEVVSWRLAGGGGWGNPFERDVERVREDVKQGYVSVDAAKRDYGVVIDAATFTIDHDATAVLRAQEGVHA